MVSPARMIETVCIGEGWRARFEESSQNLILLAVSANALAYDKPLCGALDGFTLHAATRGRARPGREALLHDVLRPPVAQERVEQRAEAWCASS
jgi:hypothetical protein